MFSKKLWIRGTMLWAAGTVALCAYGQQQSSPVPTTVGPLHREGAFVSFSNRNLPNNHIGYRFHEHLPFVVGETPEAKSSTETEIAERLEKEFVRRDGALVNKFQVREEGWVPQDWTYYIVPVEDGFDLLWVIETYDAGLNAFYAAQQCFRMSGVTNQEWRRTIAETPAFSELDLWAKQEKNGQEMTSLSHVHVEGQWVSMPASRKHAGYHTAMGVAMDERRTGGDITAATLEPYSPTDFFGIVDSNLAVRTNLAGTWVSGLYWERATHITNHHPADCLHEVMNLGPLGPHSKRAIRGKIYLTDTTLDKLFEKWQRDFPQR